MSFSLGKIGVALSDVEQYFGEAEQLITANVAAAKAGATKLQVVLADGAAVAQLVPAPAGAIITAAVDVTEEVASIISGIKGATTAAAAAVPATTAAA